MKETNIIRYLLKNKEKDVNIKTVADATNMDYKNTYNIVKRLERDKLLELKTFGSTKKLILKKKAHPLIFKAEYERRAELLKNKNLAVMLDSFNKLSTKLFVLLLFGSYAKKKNTKHSDIDLMFIVPDAAEESMEREIHSIASTFPLDLHLNIFKESDFKAMKSSKEFTVGSEAINNNVILHGIENYYEMIQ